MLKPTRIRSGAQGAAFVLALLLAFVSLAVAQTGGTKPTTTPTGTGAGTAKPATGTAAPTGTGTGTGTAKPTTGAGAGTAAPAGTGTGAGTGAKPAAGAGAGTAATPGAGAGTAATPGAGAGTAAEPAAPTDPDAVPTNLRLRRLEQRVQALKERAWRAKARVGMLKESVLGGGIGAQATLVHLNKMGSSYRLVKLVYALDGAQIFARADDAAATLYKSKSLDILTGPISPGSHTISVIAVYKGHGYGVFKYLNKYTFTVRSSHTFTASEGKATRIEAVGFEKGGKTTRLEDRPAIDFKVTAGTSAEK